MIKRKVLLLIAIMLSANLCIVRAQSTSGPKWKTAEVEKEGTHRCGASAKSVVFKNEFAQSVLKSFAAPSDPDFPKESFVPQPIFPANLIVRCGIFRVYYEDLIFAGAGFDDPTFGAARRNTLCAVLNYIQNTIKIADSVDIFISRSLTNPANPAPIGTGFLAAAGPYFSGAFNAGTPGIYGGNLYDHIINAADPDVTNYDANIIVNFDLADGQPVTYWNDFNNTTSDCNYDLFSVLLHEMTHALGFLSLIGEDGTANRYAINVAGNNRFSQFDSQFLFKGDVNTVTFQQLLQGPSAAPFINPLFTGGPANPLRSNDIWVYNAGTPVNQPAYSGNIDGVYTVISNSLLSHLNDGILSFTGMSQFSPGFQPGYVMAPSMMTEIIRRQWTLQELRILTAMNYSLNSAFAASTSLNGVDQNQVLLGNDPAFCSTITTTPITTYTGPYNFAETITPDYSVLNNNTNISPNASTLVMNLSANPNLTDNDGDPISIMPGTLFGIRGVSTNANNHARLVVSGGNTVVTYTPEPGFYGIAQFGFFLWDGHEKGALKIVTINVQQGGWILPFGAERVLNGGFEDGSEVYQRGLFQNNYYAGFHENLEEGEFNRGVMFSGAHPHNYFTNSWNVTGGTVIKDSWQACFIPASPANQGYFGFATSDWNLPGFGGFNHPAATTATSPNDRFQYFNQTPTYSTLINPVASCHKYQISFDINFEQTGLTVGQTSNFIAEFISNPSPTYNTVTTYQTENFSTTVTTIAHSTWQHVTYDFWYCSSTPASYFNLTTSNYGAFIDNISIIEVNHTPLAVIAGPDQLITPGCSGSACVTLDALIPNTAPDNIRCGITYLWTPSTGLSATNVPYPQACPTTTTTYTITVTDACTGEVSSDQVTVTVIPATNCFTLTKTANHSSTYAGQPIKYTITVCNNSSIAQNVTLTDQLPPNFFPITTPPSWPGFPLAATISVNPGCTDFVYFGYFTANGFCPDPNHTNIVTMETSTDTLTSDFCVSIMYGCPMVTYGNSDCILGNNVPVTLGVHSYILNIVRLNTWIYYPEYLTPPSTIDALTTSESFPSGNIDFPASSISLPVLATNIGGVDYYKVLIDIYYTSPVSVVPPNYFLKLNFTYTTPIPACQTSYDCWAEGPVGSTYHVDLYQPGNPNGSPEYTPWTQAAHINFVGCDGCLRPDATFTAEVKECDEHGCVTLTGNNTSPTAIHMWDFGDNRSTPFNGAQSTTWCYFDSYTDNFGNTQPGAAPGNYWVIHTVIDNGQVGIDSTLITVSGPCCKATVMIPNGTYSSSLGSGYSGTDIEVMGNFIIDNNFTFDNCIVLADPASQIIISDKGYLTVKYSDLHACSNMWKGILIEPGGVLSTYKSKISDAQYAVYAMNKSTFKIGYTAFDNNYVGVYIPPASLGANSISGAIFGSSFTQFTAFKPFYAGQTPLPGTVSYAGIEINDWTLVMSGSGSNTYFDNINNGIVARRCNLTITEAWFEKIYPDAYYGNSYDGSGIYAAGGRGNFSLTQSGFGTGSLVQKSFRNCHIGIYTERMNASISSNYMENVNNGIRFWYGRIKSAKIYKNFIDCNYYGADLRFNDGSYGIAVASNAITLGYNSTVTNKSMAVRVNDYGTASSHTSVTSNKININKGGFGVYCSKSKAVNVSSNGIWMGNQSWNRMGISQYGCDKSRVTCNSVGSAGISTNLKNQTAIYTSISPGTTISCNNVDRTYHGIRFDGASNSSDIKTNTMNKHYYGLYYGTTAVTDPQYDKGNMWNGSAGIAEAAHFGVPSLSTYHVTPSFPYLPGSINPSSGWFYNSGNSPEECSQPSSCSNQRTIGISKEEIAIAGGNFGFPSYSDETNWMTDKFLYHKLFDDPSLIANDPTLTGFMSNMQVESMGELVSVETGIENLMNDGASLKKQIDQNSSDIDKCIASIQNDINKLQDPKLSPSDEAKILQDILNQQIKIGDLQDKMNVDLDKLASNHASDADKVSVNNSNVTASKVYDENEKIINSLYLETIARDKSVFDLKQLAALFNIASQCAFGGSDAVYDARSMYNLVDDKMDFDDFDICPKTGGGMFKVSDPLSENNTVWAAPSIVPNPANDYADFYFASVKEIKRDLIVFDNVGRLVRKLTINPDVDKLTIDLNGFSQGVYYVQISSSDKSSERAKLIVIR